MYYYLLTTYLTQRQSIENNVKRILTLFSNKVNIFIERLQVILKVEDHRACIRLLLHLYVVDFHSQ